MVRQQIYKSIQQHIFGGCTLPMTGCISVGLITFKLRKHKSLCGIVHSMTMNLKLKDQLSQSSD